MSKKAPMIREMAAGPFNDLSNTTTAARFHNMPASILADAVGALDAQIKVLESETEEAQMTLKARGIAGAEGDQLTVTFSTSIRQTLDTAAVKAAMGQQWLDDNSKLAEVTATPTASGGTTRIQWKPVNAKTPRQAAELLKIRQAYDEDREAWWKQVRAIEETSTEPLS